MVERQLPKLHTRVRFPSPAPIVCGKQPQKISKMGRNAMAKSAFWVAALGLGLFGASAALADDLTLTSPDIKEGATVADEQVFKGFGCSGNNVSPALSWSGAPAATKSFAVS